MKKWRKSTKSWSSDKLFCPINHMLNCYLLVEPTNLAFLKTYNTEFDEITITFTGQNGRPLEIEDKVDLTLLIDK